MKSKAARLLNALGGEKQKWRVCQNVADKKLKNLEGDSLIAAAMVCYLAPFTQKIRDYYFAKWHSMIENRHIAITRKLNFNAYFGDPLKIKEWVNNHLPSDSFSIQNAII